MAKAVIIYESKYGNTRLVAEEIIKGIKEVSGIETVLSKVNKVDLNQLKESELILIGTPTHFGTATRSIRGFIDKLKKINLDGKAVAVFDTYLGSDYEKSVKKMETLIKEKVPGLKLVIPGLSIRVDGMKGPISEVELPKCKEFGVKIAAQLHL